MTRVHGFPPIARADARALILGTMPSAASLRAGEYYAHPRNAFWKLLGELLGFDAASPYDERKAHLLAARIALWDVLEACTRPGSLDASIDSASAAPNDFPDFFARHPRITHVYFNGATAERLYARHVLPALLHGHRHEPARVEPSMPGRSRLKPLPQTGPANRALAYRRLPSTSPANASLSCAAKLDAWRAVTAAGAGTPQGDARGRRARSVASSASTKS